MAYDTLHDRLRGSIAKKLKTDLGVKNLHALPRLQKVIVNVGINKTKMDGKDLHEYVAQMLKLITGQKPVFTLARKAISNFKTREGIVVGAVVTMRGRKMEEFVDRLLSYVLPRIRDFRGLSMKFDGHGNYAIGLRDHTIFPEVPAADAAKIFGMQIQFTTTAGRDDYARAFFKELGMPFVREREKKGAAASAPDHASTEKKASSVAAAAMEDKPARQEKSESPAESIDSAAPISDTPAS